MEHTTQAVKRVSWFALVVFVWALFVLAKLVSLQVVHHEHYLRQARRQQVRTVEIAAPRGSIYDRSGQPLAMSVPVHSVYVNPKHVADIGVASEILAGILEIDRIKLFGRMKWALENDRGFLWVQRKITPEQAERLRSLNLDWIHFEMESQRHYPKGAVAAHIVGSVDHEESGNSGLELGMDADLRGVPGQARMLTDVHRTPIDRETASAAQAGADVTLTIDERIQFAAERDLAAAVRATRAHTASAIVMDPQTGDILAMASYPSFDPSKPPARGEPLSSRLNQTIAAPFEPGSVFKVITLAAALDGTNLTPETIIHCGDGAFTFFGRVIHEAKRGLGSIPLSEVLERSSNIGAIQIALRVGQPKLYEYVRKFGFGSKTELPLPAESSGMLRRLDRWQRTSIASVAMGHEISTTTVQLARAASVIANGGLLVTPRLILAKQRQGEPLQPAPVEPGVRVLKPETAITMRKMMEGVVISERGTGRRARLDGYTSGGKTGSAQIFDFATRRYTHTYNASFMGFAPVTNPRVVVVVTLNGTSGGSAGWGGMVAAPVFKTIAQEALRVLDVPKDLPEELPADSDNETIEEVNDLAIAELAAEPESESAPEPELALAAPPAPAVPAPKGPTIPDFQGKTMRTVVEEASAMGLTVLLDGSGIATAQHPPPGSELHRGERIRVQFAR
jgi:cell division protein FtsI (penicillin-binding protein 3)